MKLIYFFFVLIFSFPLFSQDATPLVFINDTININDADTLFVTYNQDGYKDYLIKSKWEYFTEICTENNYLKKKLNYLHGKLSRYCLHDSVDIHYSVEFTRGFLSKEEFFKSGELYFLKSYHTNGRLEAEGGFNSKKRCNLTIANSYLDFETGSPTVLLGTDLNHPVMHGVWKFYLLNGELYKTFRFNNGILNYIEFGLPFENKFLQYEKNE